MAKLRIKGVNSGLSYNPIITFTKPNYGTQVDVVSQYLTLKRGNNQGLFNTNEGATYANTIGGGLNHLWMMEPTYYYPHIEGTVNLGQNPNEIDLAGVHISFSYNGYETTLLSLGSFMNGNNGFTQTVDENGNTTVTIDSTPWQDQLTTLPSLNINDLTITLKYSDSEAWYNYEGGTINLTISQNQFGNDTTDPSSGNYRNYWKTNLWNTFNPSDIDIPTLINGVYDGSNVNTSSPMVPWGYVHEGNPPLMVGREMIMLDTQDSKFYKIKFTQWTSGNQGGGLSYTRQLIRTTPTPPPSEFISVWDTTLGDGSNVIVLPFIPEGNYNCTINWGDGSLNTEFTGGGKGFSQPLHTYATPGTYTITITGTVEGWSFGYDPNGGGSFDGPPIPNSQQKLTSITNVGPLKLVDYNLGYFIECSNLTTIGGTFDLTGMTNLSNMFDGCWALTSVNGIESWNTSNITKMTAMFNDATAFNQDISGWDVSSVTDMSGMFYNTTAFNQDISSWDVSGIEYFDNKLQGMIFFMGTDGDPLSFTYYDNLLNSWSQLTLQTGVTLDMGTIEYTAAGAAARASIIEAYGWTITDGGQYFVPFVSVWDTTLGDGNFDEIILPLVDSGNYNFTVNWGDGNTDTITAWDQAEKTHTYATGGTYTVTITGTIEGWSFGLEATSNGKLTSITDIGCLKLGNTGGYFAGCSSLTAIGGTFDLSGTTILSSMFVDCTSLTSVNGIEYWNTSAVTEMVSVFGSATLFNQNIGAWDTSSVITMRGMFGDAVSFNQNISGWDTSSVTNMHSMFAGASSFNQDISGWDVSSVTTMKGMFGDAVSFNQNISGWDISNVSNMTEFMANKTSADYSYYDNLLNAWSLLTLQTGVTWDMGTIEYTEDGREARGIIIKPSKEGGPGWFITDGGIEEVV